MRWARALGSVRHARNLTGMIQTEKATYGFVCVKGGKCWIAGARKLDCLSDGAVIRVTMDQVGYDEVALGTLQDSPLTLEGERLDLTCIEHGSAVVVGSADWVSYFDECSRFALA